MTTRQWTSNLLPAAFAFCFQATAQPFAVDWHTVDGGGGTNTGGLYSVSGTVGQPDAGPLMTGDVFSLQGGYWVLPVAVQIPNGPTLFIVPAAPGLATIWWDPSTPGFVLQVCDSLTPPAWTNNPSGATNPVTVPATWPTRFYRLHKP